MAGSANVLLLEAEYLQLVSSIRALFKSNNELKNALQDDPTDVDFHQALRENAELLQKKRRRLVDLVTDMRRQGAMFDVPTDVQQMNVDAWIGNALPSSIPLPLPSDETNNGARTTEPSTAESQEIRSEPAESGLYL